MKSEKFLAVLPFSGFYCSVHDQEIEYTLQRAFDINGDDSANSDLIDKARDSVNWGLVYESYAERYARDLGIEFDLNLTFESLQSPKYYNFETDRIFAYIDRDSLAKIIRAVKRSDLQEAIAEKFTSRDGFISFYSNDLGQWPARVSEWDCNQIGTLLQVYLNQESCGYGHKGFDQYKEFDLMESAFCNGYLEDWIWASEWPEKQGTLNRLYKIAERLARKSA